MAWITDDYECTNDQCSQHGKKIEKFGKRSERDTYRCSGTVLAGSSPDGSSTCSQLLKRLPNAPPPHVSWSTWSI